MVEVASIIMGPVSVGLTRDPYFVHFKTLFLEGSTEYSVFHLRLAQLCLSSYLLRLSMLSGNLKPTNQRQQAKKKSWWFPVKLRRKKKSEALLPLHNLHQ